MSKRRAISLLVAAAILAVTPSAVNAALKPVEVTSMMQVETKQLSGALKDAQTTYFELTRQGKTTSQTAQFTITQESAVGVYFGFYQPTLFNYTCGVYKDAARKERVEGAMYTSMAGSQSGHFSLILPAGTYYIDLTEVYMDSTKQEVTTTVQTTTGSAIKTEIKDVKNADRLTNTSYIGVSYMPLSTAIKHTISTKNGIATLEIDTKAFSRSAGAQGEPLGTYALQYVEGIYGRSQIDDENVFITKLGKLTDPKWSTDKVKIILPDKVKKNGTAVYHIKETGTFTFRFSSIAGTSVMSDLFTETIDCEAPTIEGVEDGKTYKEVVTPTASDKQTYIKSATLNGEPYTLGTPIDTSGKYRLYVTDNNNNTAKVKFTVKVASK